MLEHLPRGHHVERQRLPVVVFEGERAGDVRGEQVPRDDRPFRPAGQQAVIRPVHPYGESAVREDGRDQAAASAAQVKQPHPGDQLEQFPVEPLVHGRVGGGALRVNVVR